MSKRYQHPAAFEVVKDSVGPYTAGERFKSDEITEAEGKHFINEGLLRGLDPFGEPVEHEEEDAEPQSQPAPEESVADAQPEPSPAKSAAKATKAK